MKKQKTIKRGAASDRSNGHAGIEHDILPITRLKLNPSNVRTHSKKQIRQLADSIKTFGFTQPVLVDENDCLIAGEGRLKAAQLLQLKTIPAMVIRGLSPAKRALAIADNKIPQNAGWDREKLAQELGVISEELVLEDLTVSITGFEAAEIDALNLDFEDDPSDPADDVDIASLTGTAVTQQNDLWQLNNHYLGCGDARDEMGIARLMRGELAHAAFLDPPYNVLIRSVVGRGRSKHREFAMASGEMSSERYGTSLTSALAAARRASVDGAVHYVCIDWRQVSDLITVGRSIYGAHLNVVVWVKTNAGQGSFYRSQHELIGVFRVGDSPYLNNIELGRHGRCRSNVWRYAGANTFRTGRMSDLAAHPTVKPTAMVADAIKDCTARGQIVLDTFAGSGTTILAAERVGRRARGLEIDPHYVDIAIRRWQAYTGRDAVHVDTGLTFEEVAAGRCDRSVSDLPRQARR